MICLLHSITFLAEGDEPNSRQQTLFVISIAKRFLPQIAIYQGCMSFVMFHIKNNGAYMNADNYKISTLPYIENASNEIMESTI